MATQDYFRQLRARRKAAGLCPRCGGPAPCKCPAASVKKTRAAHRKKYNLASAATMRNRRKTLTRDYIISLLRQMGFTEFPDALIAKEKLRLTCLRHAGKNQKRPN